ncbi:MAG: M61 family metallopeptidase [Gemmatimonadetes bacterium]|uniref:M61 family metallopeptidase n=1 Tax=Candidatus Kutchimonas denitrificans TaxID=3056748 RepID=A0AAE5CAU5_9BACT|nr:M61 family metallopeptidase [Gemmatimonadota bacterium]NIR73695.1 M61 family metallopeptidase [Candidatus Kutchimonas denitrificans]NIS00745.1 M61 family metallopeptidase [Gemmatimonadota bacterium]NIT66332.1 M61 family metallopeptidase [Gemmatimonadota bacterium]NIU51550.1 PDZ domain-containing protein [Gemmatimonadota bacterium]
MSTKPAKSRSISFAVLGALAVLPLDAAAAAAAQEVTPTVAYTVTVDRPSTHIFSVEMEISNAASELDVSMPVWTPGSYLIREYERHVIGFAARVGTGDPLRWRKLDKNTWRVDAGGADRVVVTYDVYARDPGIRWSFLYADGGHVLGPNLFMYVAGATDLPTSARFELPAGWRLDGGIALSTDDGFAVEADSYHELIDTPLLIGRFSDASFDVNGVPHRILILGPHNADFVRLARDLKRMVEVCAELFGGLPYDRYAFVFLTITGGGGLEHANGTTIGLGDIDFEAEGDYRRVLGVSAHEFFHAWTVKRIQPPAFRPYDYERENYTDALWFYEGITSYYGERILHRAGLIESLSDPVDMVSDYRAIPGHGIQSAADASFNAWIHHYRRDEASHNYRTNYYSNGRVIGHLLELEIAGRTGGSRGLDDVMRLIWRRTREGATFDSDDIRVACEAVAGGSFQEFFDRYVFGVAEIPFGEFFALAGYELVVDEGATLARRRTGYLGAWFREANGRPVLAGLMREAPAWRDGLSYGDEILAVNGVQVTGLAALYDLLARYRPDDRIEFTISRFGARSIVHVTLGIVPTPVYRLIEVADPTEDQLAVREVWRQLGR